MNTRMTHPDTSPPALISLAQIEQRILWMRGQKVMLDADLAALYEIETRTLIQAVKRNIDRFPDDFMFQLNNDEFNHWRSQSVISNPGAKMGLRRAPYAFTEQGVAMLSSVLKSKRAVEVNIDIMRIFVRLRHLMASNKELSTRIDELEDKMDDQFSIVFSAIRELMEPQETTKKQPIGFKLHDAKRQKQWRERP